MQEDKDVQLLYLLSRYPGRTVVFVNAICGEGVFWQ